MADIGERVAENAAGELNDYVENLARESRDDEAREALARTKYESSNLMSVLSEINVEEKQGVVLFSITDASGGGLNQTTR